jgi:hypothetical protein
MRQAEAVLTNLKELLLNDDYEACDVIAENVKLLRVALGDETFVKVHSAIKRFDFETAMQLLENRCTSRITIS